MGMELAYDCPTPLPLLARASRGEPKVAARPLTIRSGIVAGVAWGPRPQVMEWEHWMAPRSGSGQQRALPAGEVK